MRVSHLALSAFAALALSTSIAAAQVAPGTLVTNSIDLTYESGGSTIELDGAADVTFTVDRKIDLNVDGLDASATVVADQAADDAVLSFLVENLGNDTQGFDIDVTSTGSLALSYDADGGNSEGTYWVVISDNAVPGAGTETVYDVAGNVNVGDVLAGGQVWVHIYTNLATSSQNGESRGFTVTAEALNAGTNTLATELRGQGLAAVDTVFADPLLDGKESAAETLAVEAPELSATKGVTVVSENLGGSFDCATGTPVVGAESPIPGACLEYTITVSNAATATLTASNIEITDVLPADVTYEGHDVGGFDTVTYAAGSGTVTGQIAALAPGADASFTIRATVGN